MSETNETTDSLNKEIKTNFIYDIIKDDIATGKHDKIITRFPPEPNGYIHIGHAKAICVDFGVANDFGGVCSLRMDDTNPTKEDVEYVDAIKEDIKWLGFDWGENLYFASDYYGKLYGYAVELIQKGLAFVCDMDTDQMREYRGNLTEAGKNSEFRERTVEENLDLFAKMRAGEFEAGSRVLRAKIDMSSPNMNMRDPIIYRIIDVEHHRTGRDWPIYPMYDFAHPLEDAIEEVTHSLCTLEFEDHRPVYNWVLENVTVAAKPRQIEFARLNITNTVMSKRKLLRLVEEDFVSGWDDPRMPTICGMRRRGYPAAAIRDFADRIGLAKRDSTVDFALLEHCVRQDLNKSAIRVMGVMNPLKVVITNYPEGESEFVTGNNNPENEADGTREIPFSRELYIEREDFMESAPRKFFRLTEGREVRFRYAYYITCTEAIKDADGEIIELRCTYDPETKGGDSADGRKVKGTIHWVNAATALDAQINEYDHLFAVENPDKSAEGKDFTSNINPDSVKTISNVKVEPAVLDLALNATFQFERKGYYVADSVDCSKDKLVFNRTATLRDSWGKKQKK
jgi:glutaminyl-tRNA synthetase